MFSNSQRGSSDQLSLPWYLQLSVALAILFGLYGMQLASHDVSERAPSAQKTSMAGIVLPASYSIDPDGERVYNQMCASCHGPQGQGTTGVFPPVVDTDWVTGDVGRLIRLILHGLEGTIEVQGVTYSRPMPGWGNLLDDEEMAAVVNYIRTSWGNEADTVTPEEVARVRDATEGRRDAWTPEDFEEEENLGIPEAETDE